MIPTSEQVAILNAATLGSSNLLVRALAGTGKTSTIEFILSQLPKTPALYIVFNKKNAEEATSRMPSTTTVRTINGVGHRIWSKTCSGSITVDPKKTATILKEVINALSKASRQEAWKAYWEVIQAVGLAKAYGYVPEGVFHQARRLADRTQLAAVLDERPSDFVWDLIDTVLSISIRQAYKGNIDYNDQIYLPALFGGTPPRFPLVTVDELQDWSPTNHALLERLVTGRLIGVGDDAQSIYAFRGARQGGMSAAASRFSMTPMDLSVSFRCPRAVVEAARWRVPNFKWTKPGGQVEQLSELDARYIPEEAVFICRNNAPLFRLAIRLLSCGRSVRMAGTDIGPKLVGLLRKLGPENLSRPAVLGAIDDWLAERVAKGSSSAADLADCMRVFAEQGATLSQAIAVAEHTLKQAGSIRLMTIHKAKGLEFDTVYFLDSWLCREDEQDRNLRYVAQTRSKDKLFEIDSERIKWNGN